MLVDYNTFYVEGINYSSYYDSILCFHMSCLKGWAGKDNEIMYGFQDSCQEMYSYGVLCVYMCTYIIFCTKKQAITLIVYYTAFD